jgi:hypothetical protein
MKLKYLPIPHELQQIRKELLEIAEAGGGHFFYSDIRKRLESLITDGYTKQAKDLTLEIMKSYTHRPALTWELNRLLTDDEIADFETWRKTAKSNKPKSRCSKCDSTKIATIIYGIPDYSEELEKRLESGKIVLGGCCVTGNDPKYECTDCGTGYYKRPTSKDQNWTSKIKVDHNEAYSTVQIKPMQLSNS